MKNKKVIKLLLVSFSFFILSSCKKENDNNSPEPNPPSNQPLPFFTFGKIGNSWIFNNTTIGINDTANFKLTEKLNNVYKLLVVHFDLLDSAYFYWYISDTEFGFSNDSLGIDKQTLLKSDAAVDTAYLYITSSGTTIDKVISKSVSVTIPAGTFNCYQIMETQFQQPDTAFYYINKDAGIVKITSNQDNYLFRMLSKNF